MKKVQLLSTIIVGSFMLAGQGMGSSTNGNTTSEEGRPNTPLSKARAENTALEAELEALKVSKAAELEATKRKAAELAKEEEKQSQLRAEIAKLRAESDGRSITLGGPSATSTNPTTAAAEEHKEEPIVVATAPVPAAAVQISNNDPSNVVDKVVKETNRLGQQFKKAFRF